MSDDRVVEWADLLHEKDGEAIGYDAARRRGEKAYADAKARRPELSPPVWRLSRSKVQGWGFQLYWQATF